MTQAMADLKAAATTGGGFTVDPQGGQILINAFKEMLTAVEEALSHGENLSQVLPLGTSPGAQVYAPFFASVASDPHQGAIVVWKQLRQDLIDGINTIQTAMNNYQQTDSSNAGILGGPHAS
jgi:hypothetical protein